MYFISCNNNAKINKKLDKKISLQFLTKDSVVDYISLCICRQKGKAVNISILCEQRLFTYACSGILKLSMAEA